MSIKYPGGLPYRSNSNANTEKMRLAKKKHSFSNRGMTLEEEINQSNDTYRTKNIAVIHKKPIPIQVVKVNYPKRSAAVITEAYYKTASTTDYNGLYKGYYIDFEAKETKNKTSFPLKNFHEHQVEHMRQCIAHGGICFVILRFSTLNRLFLLEAEQLILFWDNQKENGRKSIPFSEIEQSCYEIQYGFSPRIPYLDAVEEIIKRKEADKKKEHE